MEKILVFSNGEKIGDGIIKLPLLYEIKKRLPEIKIYWMTDTGTTVYNNRLKNIASEYIYKIFEQANLQPFFWKKISTKYEMENIKFDFIFDTQKVFLRTLALKRIKCNVFISNSASGFFASKKIIKKNIYRKYYLDELFELLDLIKKDKINNNFRIAIPQKLIEKLSNVFDNNKYYIGYAPGAGEKNKIWDIQNFIKVANYFAKQKYQSVFFLGPDDLELKSIIKNSIPEAIFPEEDIKNFSGPEIVMASTNFLSLSLSNDSGVSHMLSTNQCPLIKLFGPKESKKFTPINSKIYTINSSSFGSKNINAIPFENVIQNMESRLVKNLDKTS